MTRTKPSILPGSVLGVVGGGQLGRMFAQAAQRLGYQVHVLATDTAGSAGQVANRATQHLYVVNPVKKLDRSARGLFSTHPAIVDRINRLRRMSGQPELDDAGIRALAGLD